MRTITDAVSFFHVLLPLSCRVSATASLRRGGFDRSPVCNGFSFPICCVSAQLANIYSTEFVVETADRKAGKHYRQVFRNNMQEKVICNLPVPVTVSALSPPRSKNVQALLCLARLLVPTTNVSICRVPYAPLCSTSALVSLGHLPDALYVSETEEAARISQC